MYHLLLLPMPPPSGQKLLDAASSFPLEAARDHYSKWPFFLYPRSVGRSVGRAACLPALFDLVLASGTCSQL